MWCSVQSGAERSPLISTLLQPPLFRAGLIDPDLFTFLHWKNADIFAPLCIIMYCTTFRYTEIILGPTPLSYRKRRLGVKFRWEPLRKWKNISVEHTFSHSIYSNNIVLFYQTEKKRKIGIPSRISKML